MSPADRKAEILTAAQELIQAQGYTGFSYQDLADRVGVAKPTLHHHFPTKEALGLALIESYGQILEQAKQLVAAEAGGPAQEFRRFLTIADQETEEHCRTICPGGALHANFETLPESMRSATLELSEAMHAWVTSLLERGRDQGEMKFEGTPGDQAWWVMSALMGGRQHARTHGPGVWQAITRQLEFSLLAVD